LGLGLPEGIAVTYSGEILLSDMEEDHLVKLDGFFEYERSFGGFGETQAGLRDPKGLFVSQNGTVYVADSQNDRIVLFDSFGNTLKIMGEGILENPSGVAVSRKGFVYAANTGKNSVVVFDPEGELVTEYRSQVPGMSEMSQPTDLRLEKENHLLVVDSGNNRILVFELIR
jgi:DNA-binding beta-propeller fold protein YncE